MSQLSGTFNINRHDALLITDIQVDFLPGGALPVTEGDKIVSVINQYVSKFKAADAHIIASRDWHPPNHISFKDKGGPWPPHCIRDTHGAEFSSSLKLPNPTLIISKATDKNREAYSAFDGTNLANELNKLDIKRLFVSGLATDYCVVNTALDALKLGFKVVILMDATLGIDVQQGDVDRAVKTMLNHGALTAKMKDFSQK